jgi:hypothetical protein
MRVPVRFASVAVGCAVLAGLSCSFPTDKSDQVHVVVTPSDSLLVRGVIQRGAVDTLRARAFRLAANGDTIDIPNVGFSWVSSDKNLARVEGVPGGGGAAEVTGVNAGYVDITARAIPFDKAAPGTETVRVASSFVIDSIRPTTMAYGGKVTFYGVGINQVAFAELGFSDLIPDFYSITGKADGVGTYSFWVPPPASSGFPFIIGPGIFGTASDSITVLPYDIFEEDTLGPGQIDINGAGGPRTFFGIPTLYYNPALAFEPVGLGGSGTDWYDFARTDTTQAVTYILGSNSFSDTAFTFLSDSIGWSGGPFLGSNAWLILPGSEYVCGGGFFFPGGQQSPTATFALRTLPSKHVQMISFYSNEGSHSLIAVRGYLTGDKRIPPDRFEEDDLWCKYSDSTFTQSRDSTSPLRKHIVVGLPAFGQNGGWFDSTLTMDNPGDVDWIRFRVQPNLFTSDTMVTISAKARPFTIFDASDIDIYVMRQSDFTYMGASTNVGSNETITMHLAPGDYYLGIVDMVQQPTRYSVCIAKGFSGVTCTPPGSAPAAAPSAAVLRQPARTPHDPTVPPANLPMRVRLLPRP